MKTSLPRIVTGAPRPLGAPTTIPPANGPASAWFKDAWAEALDTATDTIHDLLDRLAERLHRQYEVKAPELPTPIAGSRTLPVALRTVLCLDESGSTSTSDPHGAGREATLLTCSWLARYCENPADRIGLVRFADTTATIPLVRVERAEKTFTTALTNGTGVGGGTRLTPAVDAICDLLGRHGRERTVVILISDGQVAEPDSELRALIGRLRGVADAVHLLALDHDGAWQRHTHRRYDGLGLATMTPIGHLSAGHVAHAIATLLAHEAGLRLARR